MGIEYESSKKTGQFCEFSIKSWYVLVQKELFYLVPELLLKVPSQKWLVEICIFDSLVALTLVASIKIMKGNKTSEKTRISSNPVRNP